MGDILETIVIKAVTLPIYDEEGYIIMDGISETTILRPRVDNFVQAVPDIVDILIRKGEKFYISFKYCNSEMVPYDISNYSPVVYIYDGDTGLESFRMHVEKNDITKSVSLSMTPEETDTIDLSINNMFVYYIELINKTDNKKLRILQGNIVVD